MEEKIDFLSSQPEEEISFVNETHKIIWKLHEEYFKYVRPRMKVDGYGGYRLTPPIIPESHILFEATNKKTLRQEIEILIRKKIIRSFNVDIPQFSSERYFMLMNDYTDQIKSQGSQVATNFADRVMPDHVKTTITEDELKKHGFNDKDIIDLVRIHVLYIESGGYRIGIPAGMAFMESISSGRKDIVSYLKKVPDALKSDVERRYVDSSIYYGSFHTKSLIGLGVIKVIKNPSREDRYHLVYDPYANSKK